MMQDFETCSKFPSAFVVSRGDTPGSVVLLSWLYGRQVRATLRDADDKLELVSTEEQREEGITMANELEEWLYDDGWSEDAATYRKKRNELAVVSDALFYSDHCLRGTIVNITGHYINNNTLVQVSI